MTYKLIVFDWDGTLMDSAAKIVNSANGALRDMKHPELPEEQVKNIIGLGLWEAIEALLPGKDKDFYNLFIKNYREHFLFTNTTPMPLFEGAKETIAELEKQGYWMAVATGKSRKGLDQVFDETGLKPFFMTSKCADESLSKPNPQMLIEIMNELGVEPEETLMVGDTEYDMLMAHNAGVASVGVSYGVHSCERLHEHHAMVCLDNISKLPEWIQANK